MSTMIKPKIYDIDYAAITQDYLNTKTWGKSYTLFEYKTFKITVALNQIDVYDKILSFVIKGERMGYICYDIVHYKLNHPEYTLSILKRQILGSCKRLIQSVEVNVIEETAYIKRLVGMEYEMYDRYYQEAERLLNELNIENYEVRLAYADSQGNIGKGMVSNQIRDFKHDNKYLYLTDVWIMFAQLIEDEGLLKDIKNAHSDEDYDSLLEDLIEELENHDIKLEAM